MESLNFKAIVLTCLAIFGLCASQENETRVSIHCVLKTVDPNMVTKVDKMVEDGAKVIYVYFKFVNFSGPLLSEDESLVYRPLSWVWTLGRHGRSLLLLRSQYEIFSLSSLSLGTEVVNVDVKEYPVNCLTTENATIVANTLVQFLLHKFNTPLPDSNASDVPTLGVNEHICNLNIAPIKGKALFYYECCHKTLSGKTICQELKSDKYLTILFLCIFLMNFFAVMFSPLLIPTKLYRQKYQTTTYEHKLIKPVTISVRKTTMKSKGEKCLPISHFKDMPKFKETITNMHCDVTYRMTVGIIDIVTEAVRLIPSNYVPVGLFESIRASICDCEIRKKPSMKECCESNILGPIEPCNKKIPWFKVLKKFMHLLMYVFIGKFWIIRLHFFFEYEETERVQREEAASQRGLALPYGGNLTWYLTPFHTIFIVCYCIFVIDVLLFGIISAEVKDTLKRVMRKCLRDMRDLSRRSAFGWSVQILMFPFKRCGVFGIIFAGFYYILALPIVLTALAFYCLPTVNVIVRLLVYFIAYLLPYGRNCLTMPCAKSIRRLWNIIYRVFRMDLLANQESFYRPERLSAKNKILQLAVILACLLSIMSFVLLAMECLVFFVEVLMYTLIGIIINASHTLKYISLVFLLGFYARDCFSTVTNEYLGFNKFLNGYLVDKMREKVERITRINHELQVNTAFQASLEDDDGNDDKPAHLIVRNKQLKWGINRLILFLDKNDKPFITSKFFFDTCYLEQAGVPGPLVGSLVRAMQRFLLICVFLFFVVVVILAFGDEYGISATNQMFATLAGGFLPYILRFVLFKQPEPITVDPNNLSFKSQFQRKIDEYKQSWPIADIRVESLVSTDTWSDDQEVTNDVVTTDEVNKSKDNDVILEEIKPMVTNDTSKENVDLLIYDTAESA